MWKVTVVKDKETPTEWTFEVTVVVGAEGERIYNYDVTVEKEYYKELTKGVMPPVALVEHSFLFLLGKEPPEAILPSFGLKDITTYFSDYEKFVGTLV